MARIDKQEVEILELERGRPAKLRATIRVMPEVTLADIATLQPALHGHEVTEEMLERRLEEVREPMAEITPVEREARLGDIAIIDVEGEAHGELVASESRQAVEPKLNAGVPLPHLPAMPPSTRRDHSR